MKVILSLFALGMLLFSCATPESSTEPPTADPTGRYWVAGERAECAEGPMGRCYLIQREDTLVAGAWQPFPYEILGLEYEENTLYHLRLQQVSDSTFTLIELINSTPDIRLALQHTYQLSKLGKEEVRAAEGQEIPSLQLDFDAKKLAGTDGCNRIQGDVELSRGGDFKLGPLASTKKMCQDNTLSTAFVAALEATRRFDLRGDQLVMRDGAGSVLMRLERG